MLTCEICGEELFLEEDMKTHLLLSHLENDMSCPLCSLSGVSYDELSFHISTAHTEKQDHDRESKVTCVNTGHSPVTLISVSTTTRMGCHSKQPVGLSRSEGYQRRVATAQTSQTVGGSISLRTDCTSVSQGTITSPPGNTTVSIGVLGEGPEMAIRSASSVTTSFLRPAQDSKKTFPCPMCSLVCTSAFILQEHVELHLLEESPGKEAVYGATSSAMEASASSSKIPGGRSYECPLCAVVCVNSASLQEHVELHLDYGSPSATASPGSDQRLARRLQHEEEEEEERRKVHKAKREAEEFKKLQKQFGVDGNGGYRKQMETTLERAVSRGLLNPADFHNKKAELMESLASGVDDGSTRTQGVLGVLCEYYQREARDCAHVWLSADTDHYCSSEGDKGWGCGYRNFQMLLSSLHRLEPYKMSLSGRSLPSIPQVQLLIEEAWREGLDPQGAVQFNQRLQGTRAWIGATEIYAVCSSLRVRARILDFHKPTGPGDTHPRLFDWVKQYFSQDACRGVRLPPRVVQTSQPPLYLQHQGHSRSIVGVEQKKNGSLCLLLLDPGCSRGDMRKLLSQDGSTVTAAVRRMRKFPGQLKHKQYQLVAAEGMLSPEEKETRILNSGTLQAEKIP